MNFMGVIALGIWLGLLGCGSGGGGNGSHDGDDARPEVVADRFFTVPVAAVESADYADGVTFLRLRGHADCAAADPVAGAPCPELRVAGVKLFASGDWFYVATGPLGGEE